MPSTSEKHHGKQDFGEVRVTPHGTGWLIEFCGSDPETKYLPANPNQVAGQVKRATKKMKSKQSAGRYAPAG